MVGSLSSSVRGVIINVHVNGATARLDDGTLAAISADELLAHREAYVRSRDRRTPLELVVTRLGRHALAMLAGTAPPLDAHASVRTNIAFEMRLGAYLKETEAWAPPDRPAPAERHFIRKKRRADVFEARKKTT